MIRFAVDENFNDAIVRGVLRRYPEIDLVRIRDTPLHGANDPAVLEWAAQQGRVVLTHDVTTMTKHAYERVRQDKPMPGIFEAGCDEPVAAIIEDIILIAHCSLPGEWEGQVRYLPLR